MFEKLLRPKPLGVAFTPEKGSIDAHVFENPRAGVRRILFWSVRVDFQDVTLEDEDWACSLSVEWLTWHVRSWPDIDGASLEGVLMPQMVECSFYVLGEHHWMELHELKLRSTGSNTFEVMISAAGNIETDDGLRAADIELAFSADFTGVIVVKGNLGVTTAEEARSAVHDLRKLLITG